MRTVALIPARLASTRLPRKILREICGKAMIAHVYESVRGCSELDQVIVATDSEEILEYCHSRDYEARMTSPDCKNGTERVYEVAKQVAADVYVNVQGDEPLVRPEHISAMLELMRSPEIQVATVKTPCAQSDVNNPNAVKVVTDASKRALYFSRSTIPYLRDSGATARYFKHLGLYAYRKNILEKFCSLPESELERSERLEQLRLLENGIDIYVAKSPYDTIGVDTEEDLRRVEALLLKR